MSNKIEKKYLPIGTVVMLKGGKKRVMITGFCLAVPEKMNEVWDYSGCIYPEGLISTTQVLLFDHEQITKVYQIGYIDEEEKEFKKKLNEYVSKKEGKKNSKSKSVSKPKSKAKSKSTSKTKCKTKK